jgi:PAS domain S-box-containing protein
MFCVLAMDARLFDNTSTVVGNRRKKLPAVRRRLSMESRAAATRDIQALFDQAPQPMWVAARKAGRIVRVNEAALALYGYTREEFLELTASDIEPKKPEQEPGRSRFARHVRKSGAVLEVEVNCTQTTIRGDDVEIVAVSELSHRRQWEDRVVQAERMAAVGLLAGGVAHDFNNLLTIITGYSQILLSSLADSDVHRPAVDQILRASERAANLTRQLLAFSRKQKLQLKVIEVNALVQGMTTMLRRLIGEDIELHVKLSPETGRILADPGQIEQVIMNLAVNARDAMPDGGALTVETAIIELDNEYTASHINVRPGAYVLLAVSDNGAGMDAETQSRLFEPFFTTKAQGRGTGLGMSTVFGIVKQSGGNIEVYSEPGRGTSVKVYFPRAEADAHTERSERDESTAQHRAGGETILLVEDEDAVRMLVRKTLERQGYNVLDAPHAKEARRISRAHHGPIHLLITDVVMPQESGRQLAEWMLTERPEIKILYMSGYTDHAIVNSGVIHSDVAFIQKPFAPAALARKVREALEGGESKRLHAGSSQPGQ